MNIAIPSLVFGSSALGNLYREIPYSQKRDIASEWLRAYDPPICIDTAGKYGAGLALEMIGQILSELDAEPDDVIISNKLGWIRTPLVTPEPQFEPGAWVGLDHDAEARISYGGILECWEEGTSLLGRSYAASLVSVHDPDEYVDSVEPDRRDRRYGDVLDAYRALEGLRADGKVAAVGVGSKDWRIVRRLSESIDFDWVMFACSLTMKTHSSELLDFISELDRLGVGIINSAVFNGGFLTGGDYFDYRPVARETDSDLFSWRDRFYAICREHEVEPANACVEFGLSPPGVDAVALNTSQPGRVAKNVCAVESMAPTEFWGACKSSGLIESDYPHV